jgi:uncharacterized protein with FMN-binding domain
VRKTTTAIVGVASAGAIWAAWQAGLTTDAGALKAGPVVTAPPARSAKTAAGPKTASHTTTTKNHAASAPSQQPVTVDGPVVGTDYGDVQVSITHVGSRITDVQAMHLTDSSHHSVSISAYAAPILRQEALAAQSSQIDMVSGATYTSAAYQQSLQAAIDSAHL